MIKLRAAAWIAALAALVAGVAGPAGQNGSATNAYYVPGHTFGLGEQQVYVVRRSATLTVRFRDASGTLVSQTFRQSESSSVAWTIEGMASGGGPILGVTSAGRAAGNRHLATPSAQPSPILDATGAGASGGAMGELGPANFLLASLTSDLPDPGKPWFSTGLLPLRYGVLTLAMNSMVDQPGGDQAGVVLISSTGGCDLQASLPVRGFGVASLRGGGGATAASYLDSRNRLLLGMTISATSRGNVKAIGRAGSYTLDANVAMVLVHYRPGVPAYPGSPGFGLASAYVNSTFPPESSIYATGVPASITSPAATNTEFIPPPTSAVTPYPSALPEASLPPIPIPQPSGQPVASPPAPPAPSPPPSRYP